MNTGRVSVPPPPTAQVKVGCDASAAPYWSLAVAVNCWVAPLVIEGFAGVTAMDCNVAAVTVRVVEPETPPRVALMLLVPAPAPVARPPVVMVALAVVADAHVT